ncbi:hypothetical protein SAMN05421823_101474 [Catalinimonas alkaloidigena]|uniref:Uncharacterized protein n=1 Tax=Catalinimonas alkaloidigena TaxID=1075417 RepID=A0A1G8XTU7_9BACT|nr:hypothetical protein [Catalinimonas alkaloidigena]SDJ93971.1 hypothetical protein SAMN05421823_101474 [Catalinimonas alkaloidigena]
MKKLTPNWLTEGLIDFEYKKYLLLSYFQQVEACFSQTHLYPTFSELVFHYQNLISVKENKQLLRENFPKEISRDEFRRLKLIYEEMVEDDGVMKELQEIISFSLPEFERYLEEGKAIYQYVAENLHISPVGLVPLDTTAGFLFLLQPTGRDTEVYEYRITIFENAEENYRGIRVSHLESVQKPRLYTYEMLKIDLVRRYKAIANPAAYLIESRVMCPMQETLLPVAKRSFVRYMAKQAA